MGLEATVDAAHGGVSALLLTVIPSATSPEADDLPSWGVRNSTGRRSPSLPSTWTAAGAFSSRPTRLTKTWVR